MSLAVSNRLRSAANGAHNTVYTGEPVEWLRAWLPDVHLAYTTRLGLQHTDLI